jgi:bla regulator protein blaR1
MAKAHLRTIGVVAVVGSIVGSLAAQTPARPAFEVASIKSNKSGNSGWFMAPQPGGRVAAQNVPLRALIQAAYQLRSFQVVGGPSWLDSDRFDIAAKAAGDLNPNEMLPMLRTLLSERFKLAVHTETREQPIYALMLSRPDGKLGSRLRATTPNCAAAASNAVPTRPDPNGPPACRDFRMSAGGLIATGMSMEGLALRLSERVNRPVEDRTALGGLFDLEIEFSAAELQQPGPPGANANRGPADPSAPSLFTALQEQLGLKLESTRAPVEILVIDHVEQPTEN